MGYKPRSPGVTIMQGMHYMLLVVHSSFNYTCFYTIFSSTNMMGWNVYLFYLFLQRDLSIHLPKQFHRHSCKIKLLQKWLQIIEGPQYNNKINCMHSQRSGSHSAAIAVLDWLHVQGMHLHYNNGVYYCFQAEWPENHVEVVSNSCSSCSLPILTLHPLTQFYWILGENIFPTILTTQPRLM